MPDRIRYVYAIVPRGLDPARAPAGVEGAPVEIQREGELGALVSAVDAATYARDAETLAADVSWLGPRAEAHDRVVTWASDQGPVIPLPMFSLFADDAGVRRMLAGRRDELARSLDRVSAGREYGVRVFRIDSELAHALPSVSPHIGDLEARAQAATEGQRYLLERKIEGERKLEIERIGKRVAGEVFGALEALAVGAVRDPLPPASRERRTSGAAVLNAAFLVAPERLDDFRAALTTAVDRWQSKGFRFEFTGPWPPYHFAGGGDDRAR